MSFIEKLQETYKGAPLRILLVGGGSYVTQLFNLESPGELVDSITILCSDESKAAYLVKHHPIGVQSLAMLASSQDVSVELAQGLHVASAASGHSFIPLTLLANLTEESDENNAIIVCGSLSSYETWKVELSPPTEEEKKDLQFLQDNLISRLALAIATETPSELRDEMEEGGYLVKVD